MLVSRRKDGTNDDPSDDIQRCRTVAADSGGRRGGVYDALSATSGHGLSLCILDERFGAHRRRGYTGGLSGAAARSATLRSGARFAHLLSLWDGPQSSVTVVGARAPLCAACGRD